MKQSKSIYIILWFCCILGLWAIIPYIYYMGIIHHSLSSFFLMYTIQYGILFAIVLWLSYLLVPKTDLQPFNSKNFSKEILLPGIVVGILTGLLLYILGKWLFTSSVFSIAAPPPKWASIAGSVFGGINEEVLLRLFFFTLIYFLLCKVNSKQWVSLWVTNVIVAILFGVLHFPAAMNIAPLNTFEVTRILLLNGIPGLAFGWLYATRGFYAAAIAHFTTDIVYHVILK